MSNTLLPPPTGTSDIEFGSEDSLYEVIDGIRTELSMSAENILLANDLSFEITSYIRPRKLGRAAVEILFELPLPGRTRSRRPDVAFVSYDRWAQNRPLPQRGDAWPVVPDLAVEFVSPTERADDVVEKLNDYFDAGVRQVWVAYTRSRYVMVFDSLTQIRGLREADILDGGTILPGFQLTVGSIFPPRV